MKQVSQNYNSGRIAVDEVPKPALKSGGVLVRTTNSVISLGTEGMKAKESKMSYFGMALARPDQVKKVIETFKQQGFKATYQKVMNKLDKMTPLGYSTAGVVEAVASDVYEFEVGQRVACAGAGYANHAEVNFIPKNLVVSIPNEVESDEAAFATVGAIAMQGYRQADIQLGETALVIGLGLLGQILVQILKAAGMQVIGIDLEEDKNDLALENGATFATTPDDSELHSAIGRITNNKGIDVSFITAGGNSSAPANLAMEVARDRGQIIIIGKSKLDLDWKDAYAKELEVKYSRSYGPGRYDSRYEEDGVDYPFGYVRWTENRNMQSFLQLIADGTVSVKKLVTERYSFEDAGSIYDDLADGKDLGIGVILEYENNTRDEDVSNGRLQVLNEPKPLQGKVSLGVIGAGNYASSMLLPHLKGFNNVHLDTVATATSLSGKDAARKFDFSKVSTDYKSLLDDEAVDAVLIATRHNSHARMTKEALSNGKAVFVEKPLSLTMEELEDIRSTIVSTRNNRLQVGFNRRFSEPVEIISNFWKEPSETPMVATYRIQAGQMEDDSWYLDPKQGTRFLGEGGHFIDTLSYIFKSRPVAVSASNLKPDNPSRDELENIHAIIEYENGSVGHILYTTQGGVKVPKEYLEVHGYEKSAIMDNFKKVKLFEGNSDTKKKFRSIDKGQEKELEAFIESIEQGKKMPFSIDELIDTTLTTIAIHQSTLENRRINLEEYWVERSD